MKLNRKAVAGGVLASAMTGGLLLGTATSAFAATGDPSYYPDPDRQGTVTLYDAAGHQVTSGSISDGPLAAYYVGSGTGIHTDQQDIAAQQAFCTPQDGVPPVNWSTCEIETAASLYPDTTLPGAVGKTKDAVAAGSNTDGTLASHIAFAPNKSTSDPGVYEVRVYTANADEGTSTDYYSTVIKVSGTTWTQVNPPASTSIQTTTTLTVTPASPQTVGADVKLSAHVAAASGSLTNGTVKFFDGTTQIGSDVPFTGADVSIDTTSLPAGTHSLTAQYVSADESTIASSTSAASSYVIKGQSVASTTTLSADTGTGTAFSPVTLNATISPAGAAGKVTFKDTDANGNVSSLGTVTVAAGAASLKTSALAQGDHSITASFAPDDTGAYTASTSVAATFSLAAPSTTPDPQTITANVPVGTLTITTPYTPANPFALGDLVLDKNGTALSASAHFGDNNSPQNGVTVTDTRAGDLPWTAAATGTDFTKGTDVINGQNFGFTDVHPVYISGNAINATSKPVVATQVPADATVHGPNDSGDNGLKNGPHDFANATKGVGSVYIVGTLTLNAPTSTKPGLYSSVLTFTVS